MRPPRSQKVVVAKTAVRDRVAEKKGARGAAAKLPAAKAARRATPAGHGPRPAKSAAAPRAASNGAAPARTSVKPRARETGPGAASAPTLSTEVLRGGQAWSRVLARGQILRLTDTEGHACVSALFYNARDPLERYNMADTLKAQYTAFLTAGRVLYSDMGRILCSVVADSCGWHDTMSGCGDAASQERQLGSGTYQALRNDFHRNGRDNFIVELSKVGLGKRDIVANVNFFVRLAVDAEGGLTWSAGNSRPGANVELRAEMDTLVVLSNTPHPLDPATEYAPPPVEVAIRVAAPGERPGPTDPCRSSRPENGRGFALTEAYVAEVAGVGVGPSPRGESAWV